MPGVNPKRTYLALNASNGAFTVVRLSTWAKYVSIYEDPAYNNGQAQGLQGNNLDPFAQSSNITKGMTPGAAGGMVRPANYAVTGVILPQLEYGSKHALSNGEGAPLGQPGSAGNIDVPGGVVTLGTPLCMLRSNTNLPTGIVIEEYVA